MRSWGLSIQAQITRDFCYSKELNDIQNGFTSKAVWAIHILKTKMRLFFFFFWSHSLLHSCLLTPYKRGESILMRGSWGTMSSKMPFPLWEKSCSARSLTIDLICEALLRADSQRAGGQRSECDANELCQRRRPRARH